MPTYDIKFNINSKYPVVIYSISYENPIQDMFEISEKLCEIWHNSCDVLFDLLLSNGDEFNRFAIAHFNGKVIEYDTIRVAQNFDNIDVKSINEYYKNNIAVLNNGILTASQKIKIIKN